MNIISIYTQEQAIGDGILFKIAKNITCTTNLAYTLAPADNEAGFDLGMVWSKLISSWLAYQSGVYYDKGATDYPEEADAGLAAYLIDGHRVWIMPDYPGADSVTIMLPEDY